MPQKFIVNALRGSAERLKGRAAESITSRNTRGSSTKEGRELYFGFPLIMAIMKDFSDVILAFLSVATFGISALITGPIGFLVSTLMWFWFMEWSRGIKGAGFTRFGIFISGFFIEATPFIKFLPMFTIFIIVMTWLNVDDPIKGFIGVVK